MVKINSSSKWLKWLKWLLDEVINYFHWAPILSNPSSKILVPSPDIRNLPSTPSCKKLEFLKWNNFLPQKQEEESQIPFYCLAKKESLTSWLYRIYLNDIHIDNTKPPCRTQTTTRWWFQLVYKIIRQIGSSAQVRVKNNIFETTTWKMGAYELFMESKPL